VGHPVYSLYVEDLTLNIGSVFIKNICNGLKIHTTLYQRSLESNCSWFLWGDELHASLLIFSLSVVWFLVIGISVCIISLSVDQLCVLKQILLSCSTTRLAYHTFLALFFSMCIVGTVNTYVHTCRCLFVCFPAVTTHCGCIFHSLVVGFSLLVFEVSWSHTTTRHSRWDSSVRVINPSQRSLTTHNNHNRQTSKTWVGFELTIAASERP